MGGEVQVESGTFRQSGPCGGNPPPDTRNKVCLPLRLFPRASVRRVGQGGPAGGRGVDFPPIPPGCVCPPGGIRAYVFARNPPPPPSRASLGFTRHDETDAFRRARLEALHEPPGLGEFEKSGRLSM